MVRGRPSIAHFGYNLRDSWWGVPRFGSLKLAVVPEQLYQLCEVSLPGKHFFDTSLVEVKAISRKLKAIIAEMACQIREKTKRRFLSAFADLKARNQLGFGVEGHKNPLIAKLRSVILTDSPRLLSNKAPNFVRIAGTSERCGVRS